MYQVLINISPLNVNTVLKTNDNTYTYIIIGPCHIQNGVHENMCTQVYCIQYIL